jgi:two-component system NtrC family response regulator
MDDYILVVDDDPDSCDLMNTLLSHAGLAVKTAGDGAEAMALVQQEAPALVRST